MAEEVLHPRDSYRLDDIEGPAEAVRLAAARGRLHHAWLLTGPEGVGKASFAYRVARWLMGAKADAAYGPLGASPDDKVSHLIASQSHPDLMVLEREADKKSIPVDEARRLPEFFATTPALSPYRVAIVDAADDLNVNAANAVLKTLEEPPPRGVLLLVSHAPGRLLPTIRSRCRRLAFKGWDEVRLTRFVEARTALFGEDAARIARMAKGAPGRALQLAAGDALGIDTAAERILAGLGQGGDEGGLLALADKFRGGEGAERFALLFERLADRVREAALAGARDDVGEGAEAWALAWEQLTALPERVEALNLDRADAFYSALADLKAAARTSPFPH
jgi:DNA polymerase-3 subunit delta'